MTAATAIVSKNINICSTVDDDHGHDLVVNKNMILVALHLETKATEEEFDGDNLGLDEPEIQSIGIGVVDIDNDNVTEKNRIKLYNPNVTSSMKEITLSVSPGHSCPETSSSIDPDNDNVHPKSQQDVLLANDSSNQQTLSECIESIDKFLSEELNINNSTMSTTNYEVIFICDGQLPLRQYLHPQSIAKTLELTKPWWWSFVDLKKEWRKYKLLKEGEASIEKDEAETETKSGEGDDSSKALPTLNDIFRDLTGGPLESPPSVEEEQENLNKSEQPESTESQKMLLSPTAEPADKVLEKIISIAKCMLKNKHSFEPEKIQSKLEQGIYTRDDCVDGSCVVRARGLPWTSSDQDIASFFKGLNIAKGGVAICLSPEGRRNGEALVRFDSPEQRDLALRRHLHYIGSRYIEVYKANGVDFLAVAGGANSEAQTFLTNGGQLILKMEGLPYNCTAKQVCDFFSAQPQPVQVLEAEQGVLFVRHPNGQPTGDAFVTFALEEDGVAALAKHRKCIGFRYIQLFQSSIAEVQQVFNRCLQPTQEQLITIRNRKDCLRLRGLPNEAQVKHILEFLGEFAKSIVYHGVHLVYNSEGQPSGEAFVQMDSEHSAFTTAQSKHLRYMICFTNYRCIKVFQCSAEDLNLVLTNGRQSLLRHSSFVAAQVQAQQQNNRRIIATAGMSAPPPSRFMSSPLYNTPPGVHRQSRGLIDLIHRQAQHTQQFAQTQFRPNLFAPGLIQRFQHPVINNSLLGLPSHSAVPMFLPRNPAAQGNPILGKRHAPRTLDPLLFLQPNKRFLPSRGFSPQQFFDRK